MRRQRFFAKCPCCGAQLRVDLGLRRIEAAEADKAPPPSLLDDANEVLDQDQAKRRESFDRAFEEETDRDKPSLDDFL